MTRNIRWFGFAAILLFFLLPLRPAVAQQTHEFMACFDWCNGRSECKACSSASGCGSYYTSIVDFSYRWFACRPRNSRKGRQSESNRNACLTYCARTAQCDICSTYTNCGTNYRRMRSFTGAGRNWYACQDNISNTAHENRRHRLQFGRRISRGTISVPGW